MDERIDYRRSFRDTHGTFTEEQVKTETARCLGCGASVVDPNKCIGCGICTTKCEFDAIRSHRELPECSTMVRSEDKFKAILPYMIKREFKIRFGKKGRVKCTSWESYSISSDSVEEVGRREPHPACLGRDVGTR